MQLSAHTSRPLSNRNGMVHSHHSHLQIVEQQYRHNGWLVRRESTFLRERVPGVSDVHIHPAPSFSRAITHQIM